MVRSKSAKRFERLAHTVMILVTICETMRKSL